MVLLSLLFGLVYNFAALLAGAYRLTIYILVSNTGSLATSWAYQHNLCCKHRSLFNKDATLWGTLIRLSVALNLVNALNYNLILLRQSLDNLALLAFIFTGQYQNGIALLYMQFCK
jgi:hypothetical protein